MNNEEKILHILTQMQSDILDLKQGQTKLEQSLINLEQRQVNLEQGQIKLEQRQIKLENELQTVKNTVIRIENQHGKKLDALTDSYIQLYDISLEIRQDFAELKVSQEKQELSIKLLESNTNY